MKQEFLLKKDTSDLFILFLGWGMDPTPFQYPPSLESDIMICYDYRSLDFDERRLSGYSSIYVTAWSMGVWVASHVLQGLKLPFKQKIAVNGTMFPIDAQRGILPSVFQVTLDGLSEASLLKFYRRMCGSSEVYEKFMKKAPKRSLQEVKEELIALGEKCLSYPTPDFHWEVAIVGLKDRIFLPENQRNAWYGNTKIMEIDAPHYNSTLLV